MINRIRNKLYSKNGYAREITAHMVVSLATIFLFLGIAFWKIDDMQYKYIEKCAQFAGSTVSKYGVMNEDIDLYVRAKVERMLGTNYELTYWYRDYDAIVASNFAIVAPTKISNASITTGKKFKRGDMFYVQIKSTEETLYSKLVGGTEEGYILTVDERPVEVNAE